jgi:hypothetical protein
MSAAELPEIFFTAPDGHDCVCPHRDSFDNRMKACKRRFCPRCGVSWARAWATVTKENLEAYGGPVAMVSITAPGIEVLPWDCDRDHQHSGPKGCRVKQDYADVWAEHARDNWKRLRDAARRSLIRAGVEPPRILQRVWEPQKRGVPHLHIVLGMATEAERTAASLYVDELARLAHDYVFGFVDRRLDVISAAEVGRYLSGYLLGRRSKKKASIRENIADPRMPRSLIWMTPVLTRITYVTMRRLRYARWVVAALAGRCDVYPELEGDFAMEVAKVCVALERTRILRGARSPTEQEARRRHAQLGYFRFMRAARLDSRTRLQRLAVAA